MEAGPRKEKKHIQADPKDLCALADHYKQASEILRKQGKARKPMTWAPFRLCAIHAIELYLNAFLLHKGIENKDVRDLQHNLTERADRAIEKGLPLRKLTREHLDQMHEHREYLMTRYNPEMTTASEINRVEATLKEVAGKVSKGIRQST